VTLEQRVERADHHLRVACARQSPGRVAQDRVLALVELLAELRAQQAHERAQTLERLADVVDRLLIESPPVPSHVSPSAAVPAADASISHLLAAEQLDREVELAERDPPQSLGQGLARQQGEAACALALGLGRATRSLGLRECDTDRHRDARRDRGRERRNNGAMSSSSLPPAPWWTVRPAANRKPATYRCPICGHHLPALSEHMLIAPEGDTRRRRHAHTDCVLAARARGELPLREDWRRAQPHGPSLWRRLTGRA